MSIYSFLNELPSFSKVLENDKIKIGNSCDDYNMMLIACDFYTKDASIFVVLPNLYLAQKYYDSLVGFVGEDDVLFFPADELISA